MKMPPILLSAIIISSCAVIVIASAFSLASSQTKLSDSERVLDFMCGYRYGLIAVINRLPSLFPDGEHMSPDLEKRCGQIENLYRKTGGTP